jgi:hypothetical protein
MSDCGVCVNEPVLGSPSEARWLGPDGNGYCSMHFINAFGHAEPLVKIEGYEPPKKAKPPVPKKPKGKAPKSVKA